MGADAEAAWALLSPGRFIRGGLDYSEWDGSLGRVVWIL